MAVYVCYFVERVGVVSSQQHLCGCGDNKCKHKRLVCCGEFKRWCRCPYPTRTFAYGREQFEYDCQKLEEMHIQGTQMYTAYLDGNPIFNFFDWPALLAWERRIDGMRQRCKGRLLVAAMHAEDEG